MNAESGAASLAARLAREIELGGPISFATFMDRALYDPADGYYSRGAARLGPEGDYFTASDVGTHFGRALARQLVDIAAVIAPDGPFPIVEIGCGRGLLMRDLLDTLGEIQPSLYRRVRPILVDRSARMRVAAGARVPEAEVYGSVDFATLDCACILAIELFDALPVHRVRRHRAELVEVGVGLDEQRRLVETEIPAPREIVELARKYGAAALDGDEAEVCPAAAQALRELLAAVSRAVLLVFDYGDTAQRLYAHRPQGTLVAYRKHQARSDLLEFVGDQDLTAHVNFSLIEDTAREVGALVLGRTTQDRFLIANGILEVFEPGSSGSRPGARESKQRLQAMQLIHPSGMGRIFKVLALAQSLAPLPDLVGFRDPFASDPAPQSR